MLDIMNVEYNRGASGVIFINKKHPGIIVKKTKKSCIEQEYEIHKSCYNICANNNYTLLRIPRVYEKQSNKMYAMEKIDDQEMVTNPDGKLKEELGNYIEHLKMNGIIAFDYELYLQNDGTVYMIDFDRFVRLET